MKKYEDALHRQMKNVHVSSGLRAKTIQAMKGHEEENIVKHKVRTALVMALVCVLCAAAALAAAGQMGLLDYLKMPQGTEIPENAGDYIDTDIISTKHENYTVNVREAYYDGEQLLMTVDVIPPEGVLLIGEDMELTDNWQNLVWPEELDESDTRTVQDYYRENGYKKICSVGMQIRGDWEQQELCSMDWVLSQDNVMTIFMKLLYTENKPHRDVGLTVSATPYDDPEAPDAQPDYTQSILIEGVVPLEKVETAETNELIRVNEAPMMFDSIGVRVDRVVMEEKPLEIHYTIEYTVVDPEKYKKTDYGLWFEFIDPNSTAEEPYEQRLKSGPSADGESGPVDGDVETARHFRETGTLALSEKADQYTLRAYECWEKQRFDTCTFTVRPGSEEDLPQ